MKRGLIIITLIILSIFLVACDSQELNQCDFDYNSINDIKGVIVDEKVVSTGKEPWVSNYTFATIKLSQCEIITLKSSVIFDGVLADEKNQITKTCLDGKIGEVVSFKGHYKRYSVNSKAYYDLTPTKCSKEEKEIKKAVDI